MTTDDYFITKLIIVLIFISVMSTIVGVYWYNYHAAYFQALEACASHGFATTTDGYNHLICAKETK